MSDKKPICGRCNTNFRSEKYRNEHLKSCLVISTNHNTGEITVQGPVDEVRARMPEIVQDCKMMQQNQ